MEVTNKTIANNIADIFEEKRDYETIKNKEKYLNEKTGISIPTLKHILAGTPKRGIVVDDLISISDALGVSLYRLITGVKDDNHVVCEELGLSNHSVEVLKEKCLYFRNNQLVCLIDVLTHHLELASYLYGYLTEQPEAQAMLTREEYEKAMEVGTPFDNQPIIRKEFSEAHLLLALESVLRSIREEVKNEKGEYRWQNGQMVKE